MGRGAGQHGTGLNAFTGFGYHAGRNCTGEYNTTVGWRALYSTTSGYNNTANGYKALYANITGYGHTASGIYALMNITAGHSCTAMGPNALDNLTSGTYNIGIGKNGRASSATADYELTIGDSNINNFRCNDTSISGLSDQRDKAEITDLPEDAGLDFINDLRPVTFYWDRREWYEDGNPDGSKIKRDWRSWKTNSGLKQGFVAQEVQTAIEGKKCLEDSMIVTDGNPDKLEFAPAHLLTNAIKAIQQLSAENEALKIRLTALENA